MAQEVNYLVFDILGDLCFGKQFNMKEPGSDIKHVPELMATFLELLAPVCIKSLEDSPSYIHSRLLRSHSPHTQTSGSGSSLVD